MPPADAVGHLTRRTVLLAAGGAVAGFAPYRLANTGRSGSTESSTGSDVTTDAGAQRLQDVIDAAAEGALVVVTRPWSLAVPLVIDRRLTLQFVGGSLATDRDIDLISVRASDVAVLDAVLTGSGADHSGLGRGIRACGTPSRPLAGVRVVGADIRRFPHDGVLLEHCSQFLVASCTVEDVGYAGVLLSSCSDGAVTGNRIHRVLQPSPYPNSYGIEAARATRAGLDDEPRSSRVVIADNHVSDVLRWEGIDTHGGEAIAILRNRIENCRVGVALVPSKDEADATRTKYAPIDCAVVDNTISRSTRSAGSGIVVRGAGETVGDRAERATGVVRGNTVTGYGDGDRDAGILVYLTRDLVIAHNRCTGGVRRGVTLYHSNADTMLVGNAVSGLVAQGTAASVAFDVRSTGNTAVFVGNRYESAGSDAPVTGVTCKQPGNDLVLLANDWNETATAVIAKSDVVVRYRED